VNHGPPVYVIHLTVRSDGGTHDGAMLFQARRAAMYPTARLKLSAVVFTVLWTGWMLWWSGSFDRVNIIVLATCGGVTGYAWYRAMRWRLPRGRVPSRHGPSR
jgi:threonine/homoserine efflux transporter RhtA